MQTFLPYRSFEKTARCLDHRRLGKQRVECKQILSSLTDGGGWKNHPAVKMWRGYEGALVLYAIAICEEWIRRGYNDSLLPHFKERLPRPAVTMPPWLGRRAFHRSHQSNLKRKDPIHYAQFNVPDDLEYVWPVQ